LFENNVHQLEVFLVDHFAKKYLDTGFADFLVDIVKRRLVVFNIFLFGALSFISFGVTVGQVE